MVHVSQWSEEPDTYTDMLVKKFKVPANSEEAKNDPIEWEFIKNSQIGELNSHIDGFVRWLADHETTSRQHVNKKN